LYAKVNTPEIVSREWLDQAFAPLVHYLNQKHSEQKERILANMMFMCNEGGEFHYKNQWSRSYIIFDQSGELMNCSEDAICKCLRN
jgi:membrane-associated PAP2 superfamily phosphatase